MNYGRYFLAQIKRINKLLPEMLFLSILFFAVTFFVGKTIIAGSDYEAGKILFEAFKDLTPMQAAQSHFWQYLSHVDLYEYMRRRWNKVDEQDCDPNYIAEHWFYKQNRNWLESHGL